jgi:hypothetical protein
MRTTHHNHNLMYVIRFVTDLNEYLDTKFARYNLKIERLTYFNATKPTYKILFLFYKLMFDDLASDLKFVNNLDP